MTTFDGQVVLITGGASGIGRAAATALSRSGARVVIADLDLAGAEALARELDGTGRSALAVHLDVANSTMADAAVARTVDGYGGLDVLVHCAGINNKVSVVDMSDDEWRRIISVDLDGTFYVTRAAARVMAPAGHGTMILLASDRGLFGGQNRAHYAAAKGAVIAYAKSLALELGPRQVTVNAINPGRTNTPRHRAAQPHSEGRSAEESRQSVASDPLGRLSEPEDIAELIQFLAGPGGKFMTGQLITVRMRIGGDQLIGATSASRTN